VVPLLREDIDLELLAILFERLRAGLAEEGIPLLRIESDYGDGDSGQLKTRIEAFLEMIRR